MPQAGEQIGPYTLVRQLGKGAFGLVWLAERRGAFATTQVALKMALDDEPDLDAIAQESQLWAQLGGHPNVLPIIEAERYDQYVVVISEYAPDGTLDSWLKKNGGISPSISAAVTITIGILNGLEHLHSKKIIHRDLKPANILLQGKTPRLADFGLARVLKSSMKSTGVAGTPSYMAPEVFDGERSVQSDLWSVGVVLYQMLSGHLPFPQSDLMALLGAIARSDPKPLPNYVPFALAQVVAQALQKNPAKRYRSALEMCNQLQTIALKDDVIPPTLHLVGELPTMPNDIPNNSPRQTNPEQTEATLFEVGPNNRTQKVNPIPNKTVEQVAARPTQQDFSQNIPLTEKYTVSRAESDKINRLSKVKRVVVGAALFFIGWGVLAQMPGSFGKFFPFPIHIGKKDDVNNKPQGNLTTTSIPSPPKVEILNSDKIKDSNKLAVEIGKKLGLLETTISTLPKGKDKRELEEAFSDIQKSFEEVSSDDINPENLVTVYESYIVGLNSLIASTKIVKTEPKAKMKSPTNQTSEISIPNVPLPASPNIPIPNENENAGVEMAKSLQREPNQIKEAPSPETIKQFRQMSKEMRILLREAKKREKEEAVKSLVVPLIKEKIERGLREQQERMRVGKERRSN